MDSLTVAQLGRIVRTHIGGHYLMCAKRMLAKGRSLVKQILEHRVSEGGLEVHVQFWYCNEELWVPASELKRSRLWDRYRATM